MIVYRCPDIRNNYKYGYTYYPTPIHASLLLHRSTPLLASCRTTSTGPVEQPELEPWGNPYCSCYRMKWSMLMYWTKLKEWGWLFEYWVGWLAGRLIGWLAGRLIGWLAGRLIDWLAGRLMGWLAGRLIGWLVGWLAGCWLFNWLLIGWLVGVYLTYCVSRAYIHRWFTCCLHACPLYVHCVFIVCTVYTTCTVYTVGRLNTRSVNEFLVSLKDAKSGKKVREWSLTVHIMVYLYMHIVLCCTVLCIRYILTYVQYVVYVLYCVCTVCTVLCTYDMYWCSMYEVYVLTHNSLLWAVIDGCEILSCSLDILQTVENAATELQVRFERFVLGSEATHALAESGW